MKQQHLPTNPNYLISEDGTITSLWNPKKPIKLKPRRGTHGYYIVNLWNGTNYKTRTVHRLVAEAFLGIDEALVVNHKDNDRTNNALSNLEVCTQAHNVQHALAIGATPVGEKHYNAKLSDADVLDIRQSSLSLNEIAKKYNISKSHACGIRKGAQRRIA